MIGNIYDAAPETPGALVGPKVGSDGEVYDLRVSSAVSSPMIQSWRTGRWFTLSWNEILDLAQEAGIGDLDPETTGQ